MDGIEDPKKYRQNITDKLLKEGQVVVSDDDFYRNLYGDVGWQQKQKQLRKFGTDVGKQHVLIKRGKENFFNEKTGEITVAIPEDNTVPFDLFDTIRHELGHNRSYQQWLQDPIKFKEIYGGERTKEGKPFYSTNPKEPQTPSATEKGDPWEEVIQYTFGALGRRLPELTSSPEKFWSFYTKNRDNGDFADIKDVLDKIQENPYTLERFNILLQAQVQARPSIRINPQTNKLEFYPQT